MLRLVVPMFQDIFRQNQVELPGITKFIIATSDFIRDYGWWILLLILGLLLTKNLYAKRQGFKRRKDHFLLKLPYIGNFIRSVYMAQFTQAVSLLTGAKVPVLNSIELVGRMIDFYPLKDALGNVEKKILEGKSLSQSLGEHKIFDHRMVALLKVAGGNQSNGIYF